MFTIRPYVLPVFFIRGRSQQNAKRIWSRTLTWVTDYRVCLAKPGAFVTHPSSHNGAATTGPLLLAVLITRNTEAGPKNTTYALWEPSIVRNCDFIAKQVREAHHVCWEVLQLGYLSPAALLSHSTCSHHWLLPFIWPTERLHFELRKPAIILHFVT
jgi:hypothetical protein